MFRKEINYISDLNFIKLQNLGDRFTIHDIKRIEIHPALLQFVESAVDNEILNDRKKIEDGSNFDYSSDRINNYFTLISDEIKRTQIFSQSYLRQLIQKGIIFNINYLIKPHKALTKLIFDESEIKTIEEIVIGISHAYYYQYLKKIVLTYLEKKKVLSMRKDEFFSLLQKIDSISKQTHLDDTISTAVNSLANFFDQDKKIPEIIPIDALKLYLQERELNEFLQYLEENYIEKNIYTLPAAKIIQELRSVIPETEIEIVESKKIEDELVADSVENIEIETESSQKSTNDESSDVAQGELLEVQEDDLEIPNNQILSDENIDESDNDERKDESSDEDLKKKPNAITLLKKLFNINSIYESILSQPKPFEDFLDYKEMFSPDDHLKKETDYKIDHFTLGESIEVNEPSELTRGSEEKKETPVTDTESNIDNKEIIQENIIPAANNISDTTDDTDIDSTIDEIIEDKSIEEEYIAENKTMEVIDQDIINAEELENSSDNIYEIRIDTDDELTEVFTDLTFLDNVEEDLNVDSEEPPKSENVEKENTEKDHEEIDGREEDISIPFKEMILQKDMTKIIEFIFDYDMEDYHLALNRISESNSEEEAFSFVDNYCRNNHIEINSSEVNQFKSLISDYYAQAYS